MADDRLTGLDASFLHLEDQSAHMHVGAVLLFDGEPPEQSEVADGPARRLPLVPRYRQKLGFVPLGQGRPVWVDDPHFNLDYHVRKTALPAPGREEQLRNLAGGNGGRTGPAVCFPRGSAATSRCGSCGWSRGWRATASPSCPKPTTR